MEGYLRKNLKVEILAKIGLSFKEYLNNVSLEAFSTLDSIKTKI